jgi:hypothetical protein
VVSRLGEAEVSAQITLLGVAWTSSQQTETAAQIGGSRSLFDLQSV